MDDQQAVGQGHCHDFQRAPPGVVAQELLALTETTDNEFQREVVEALRSYVATITYPTTFCSASIHHRPLRQPTGCATAAQVFEAYRSNEFEWVFGAQGTTWILLVNPPGEPESVIGFAVDWPPTATPPPEEAITTRIMAGTRGFASGFELCSG